MEIVLLKDVAKVGGRNQIVTVSEGYAINFLIPHGLAKAVTPGILREIDMRKVREGKKQEENIQKIHECISCADGKTITIHERANEQGHLFGALHVDTISAAVYDQLGVSIPDDAFGVHDIKELGTFEVPLSYEGKKGKFTVLVERQQTKT